MQARNHTIRWVAAAGLMLALLGSAWLVHAEWTRLRGAFDTQARIIHEEAIRLTRAPGVDVSSGVESAPGIKDVDKIAAFLKAVAA